MIFNILGYAYNIRQGETKCNHTSNEKVLGSHKKKIFFFLEMVVHAHPCEIKFFHFQFLRSRIRINRDKSFSILEPQVQTTSGSAFK